MKLSDYILNTVDNRGRNPETYLAAGPFPVLDNFLIKNSIYPDISQVTRYIDADTYTNFLRGYLTKGMVVITLVGNGIGNVTTIPNDKWVIIQNTIGLVTDKEKLNDLFLYYFLLYKNDVIKQFDRGSGQPSIRKTDLLSMEVSLPDIDVQKKIAGVLSALDDKIELNNQINSNLEQQAQALLAKHNESINTKCPLGTVLNFANGFAFKSTDYLPNGKYKIITIKNVQDGKVDSQGASCINKIPEKLSETCILRIGDILLSLTGNVGRVGIVCEQNLLLNQRVAKILPKKPNLHAFLYFVLRQPAFKTEMENISKGTAQQNLSPIEMLNLNITYSETETNKISSTLDSYFDDIICNTIEIYNLNKIRDSLLPKLMSGEIDVSKVDIEQIVNNKD